MARRRRTFARPLGERRYKTLFLVAVEGSRTEPEYFDALNVSDSSTRVVCLPSTTASDPGDVLKRMKKHIDANAPRTGDEAWLVIDRDHWTEAQIEALYAWSRKDGDRHVAPSNPSFELWLLLHFEDGAGAHDARTCVTRLRRHLPHYDKGVIASAFPKARILEAVTRARKRDAPPCADWPRSAPATTVYRLVARILDGWPQG
jgi:hypothetical protein